MIFNQESVREGKPSRDRELVDIDAVQAQRQAGAHSEALSEPKIPIWDKCVSKLSADMGMFWPFIHAADY